MADVGKKPKFKYEVQCEGNGIGFKDTFTRPEDAIEVIEDELANGFDDTTIIIKKRPNS